MKRPFDLCVIFAEMRTGSNHLEAMLDGVTGLVGLGEIYNPSFIGNPRQSALFGVDLGRREAEPETLLTAIRLACGPDLPIFRFFHDHDHRMLAPLLDDPRIAKVMLTRNPLDSYLSRKIATQTGQWKMTDSRARKTAEITFEATEFEAMLTAWQGFAAELRRGLQCRGQTAFEIDYADLADWGVLTGLLRHLGNEEAIDPSASRLKPQNPGGPLTKVVNPGDMESALGQLDPLGLMRPGRQECARTAAIKSIVVSDHVMLLPVPGVLTRSWQDLLRRADGEPPQNGFSQRDLRQWMRRHPGHSKIACVQHPLARAHAVFCAHVLPRQSATADFRRRLRNRYAIPLPQDWPDPAYDVEAHRAAFAAFLTFLKSCIAGQTSLALRPEWAGQLASLQGLASFAMPDRVLRAENLEADFAALGLNPPGMLPQDAPFALGEIYDSALETLARQAYRRDYTFLGYSDWSDQAALGDWPSVMSV